MRRFLVVGNWKMNTTLSDAVVLANAIKKGTENLDIEVAICPPSVWLVTISELFHHKSENLSLGAQNMWFADYGQVTGEISPSMLKHLTKYVILGHSERRLMFGETDALVNDKVQAALKHNIIPIICVGELKKLQIERRGRGRPATVDIKSNIFGQLEKALKGVAREYVENIVIAYEPVWAISRGKAESKDASDGAYANLVIEKLRTILAAKYGRSTAERVRILYGGSVTSENITEFIYQPEIDGALVGASSLNAKEFIEICRKASSRPEE